MHEGTKNLFKINISKRNFCLFLKRLCIYSILRYNNVYIKLQLSKEISIQKNVKEFYSTCSIAAQLD